MKWTSAVLWVGCAVAAMSALGCAQVKVVQRNGCWVKQTETFPKTIREEVGPCARKEPKWSDDRVARLVQECMAEADYRWQTEAMAAWNRGAALPPQKSEQTVMKECMDHAATALVTENETLKKRLAEISSERDQYLAITQQDREHLRNTQDRMTDALGEAAKKPAPNAYATANSSGTANTQSDLQTHPAAPVTVTAPAPAAPPVNVDVTVPVAPIPAAPKVEEPKPAVAPPPPVPVAPEAALTPSCSPAAKPSAKSRSKRAAKDAPALCPLPKNTGKLAAKDEPGAAAP